MKRLLWAVSVALAGCKTAPEVVVSTCPDIPASLTRDCGRCADDAALPKLNGELLEAYFDCRQCSQESRIRLEAIRELAGCRQKEPAK